jgi:hypothetical protein
MLLPDFVLDWLARLRDGRSASAKRIYAFYGFSSGLRMSEKNFCRFFTSCIADIMIV